jgi:hypothetical protein
VVLTVPQAAPTQPAPVTVQVTLVLAEPVTVAVNCCVPLVSTFAVVGLIATAMTATIVTVAEADFVGSAALVAVTLTVFGAGATAGAVYKPAAVIVPQAAPEQPAPVTVQVTF